MKKVVITGGGGYLAGYLNEYFLAKGDYEVILINRSPREGKSLVVADISEWDTTWTKTFDNAYAIIHLAAQRIPGSTWEDLQRTNIEGTFNVFEAAAQGNARRVIFASSSRVLSGYFNKNVSLTPDLPPDPKGKYEVSKMVGESIARHYATQRGLSVVCFRVGACHTYELVPHRNMKYINQLRWLSPRDFCQGMERAVEVDGIGFSLLHLSSDVVNSRWDISETKRILGYSPQDCYQPEQPQLITRLRRSINRRLRLK